MSLTEKMLNRAQAIPIEYRARAKQFAEYRSSSTTLGKSLLQGSIHNLVKTEVLATAAGGLVGYLSGDTAQGFKDGAMLGVALYAFDQAVAMLSVSSVKRAVQPESLLPHLYLMNIGSHFQNSQHPIRYIAREIGIRSVAIGVLGRPVLGDWSGVAIGAFYGLAEAAIGMFAGEKVIAHIKRYGLTTPPSKI